MYSIVAVFLLLPVSSWANEHCKRNNIGSFYNYIKKYGHHLHEVSLKKEQVATAIDVAEQRPNPITDINYLRGNQFGQEVNTYSLSAKHVVELGSKRDRGIIMKLITLLFLGTLMCSQNSFAQEDIDSVLNKKEENQSTEKKSRRKKIQMCHECGKPETECECKGEGHGVNEEQHNEEGQE